MLVLQLKKVQLVAAIRRAPMLSLVLEQVQVLLVQESSLGFEMVLQPELLGQVLVEQQTVL
jgi:hypothetical protein